MAAAEKAFELSVLIEAIDRFTGPMKGIEASMASSQAKIKTMQASMKNLGSSAADIERVTKAMKDLEAADQFDRLATDLDRIGMSAPEIDRVRQSFTELANQREHLESLHTTMQKFEKTAMVGVGMTAAGGVMAYGLAEAAKQAGELLTVMTTIQDATGATNQQMAQIQQTIRNTSMVTKYGQQDVSGFAQILGTSGYNAGQVNALLPDFTRFAEVQEYGKGMDPTQSIKQAIELAHGFGHYDPKSLMNFLNQYNKATFLQPEDSSVYGETLKYTMTTAQKMGMSDQDTLFMAALANRMGLAGSMGGTNAADMIMRLVPGLIGGMHKTKTGQYPRALEAMMRLGLADAKGNSPLFKNGRLVSFKDLITQLYERTKNLNPEQQIRDFKDIFGIQGMRFANLVATQRGQEQLQALVQGSKHISSISKMQEDYLKTPEGQLNQLRTNLQNLKMNVFLDLAKNLNPFIHNLNIVVERITKFSDKHPKVAQYIATFALMATGLMLIAGPLTSLIGLFGMLTTGLRIMGRADTVLKLVKDFKELGGAASFLIRDWGVFGGTLKIVTRGLGIFGSFIGRITGLTKVWSVVTAAFNAIMDANPIAIIIIGIAALIAIVILMITHWKQVKAVIAEVWAWMKSFAKDIGSTFSHLWKDAVNWGANIIRGLWNGIKGFGSWLGSKIQNFVSDHITGPFKHILGIHSPSTVFMEHGKFIVQGLALGIQNNQGLATRAAKGLANATNQSAARETMVRGSMATAGGATINIYPHKHQKAEEIAEYVLRKLGKPTGAKARRSGVRLNPAAR